MTWRYQPVWIQHEGRATFGVCEVYFNSQGELDAWSEAVQPAGISAEDLRWSLANMLTDAWKWKPVNWSELKPGFQFEMSVQQNEVKQLADFLETKGIVPLV